MGKLRLPAHKLVEKAKMCLKRFDAVSSREKNMLNFLDVHYECKSSWVLDPVFLPGKEFWLKLAEKSEQDDGRGKVVSYILDPTNIKRSMLSSISEKLKIPTLNMVIDKIAKNKFDFSNVKDSVDFYEWLANIAHCRFFVTDSFHGVCFALIFNKPFICINNESRGAERFSSLLNIINLRNRIFPEDICPDLDDEIFDQDYKDVNNILGKYIVESQLWLKNALYKPRDETVEKINQITENSVRKPVVWWVRIWWLVRLKLRNIKRFFNQ